MKKLFMASIALSVLSLAVLLFQMVSCRKVTAQLEPPSTMGRSGTNALTGIHPIEGLWTGTYNINGSPGSGNQYYALTIKPDSTLIVDSKDGTYQHLSIGTWSLNDTVFTATFTCVYGYPSNVGITEELTATWSSTGTLTGTWNNIPPLTGTGNISLQRVN